MKKVCSLLFALLMLLTVAFAEAPAAVPAQIVPDEAGLLRMTDAIAKAEAALEVVPSNCQTNAQLVRMTDDSLVWVVSIFDLSTFTDAWCIGVDAATGNVVSKDVTTIGFFTEVNDRWVAAKGPEALWSLEDKLLYDTLYNALPTCGMPGAADMPQGEAMVKAMTALGLTANDVTEAGYEVGYGYIMGSADGTVNGVWEVYFVKDGVWAYKVNLDAVTGEVYLVEPDLEGNG